VQLVTKTKKMFVGGLSASTTVEDVRSYFEQFGKVSPYILLQLQNHVKVSEVSKTWIYIAHLLIKYPLTR